VSIWTSPESLLEVVVEALVKRIGVHEVERLLKHQLARLRRR
jgi:hypothetical protein